MLVQRLEDTCRADNRSSALETISDEYLDSATMRAKFTAIVDSIVSGATTLSTASSDVLRELTDQGTYLETGENFISTYKSRYNRLPLMPVSLLTTYLRNLAPADRDVSLFPEQTQGTEGFKLAYGSRLVLNKKTAVTLDNMPGVKALLDTYNGVTQKRDQVPADQYQSYIQRFLDGLRFIIDTRNFASYLCLGATVPATGDNIFMDTQVTGEVLVLSWERMPHIQSLSGRRHRLRWSKESLRKSRFRLSA